MCSEGPDDLTVTKLSAHAAVICWKFPSGQQKGAHGYYLRYGRRPVDLVASQQQLHGQVLELKLTDSDVAHNVIMPPVCIL